MKLNVTPLLEAIEQYIAKADNDLEDQLNEEGYVEAGVAVSHMRAIEDGVTAAVENNVDEVLARLQSASGVDDFIENVWPEISNSDEMEKALYDLFYQQFDELLRRFTKQWIISADAELGEVVDDRITRPAEAFIKGWSQQLADIMHLNTKDGIEKILLDAQEQNQTIDEVAQAIADSGIRECGYRSRRVAVTEVLRVEEYAHQEARIQNPSCYKKEWVHTGAAHPRENHVAINGQQVFKREPFTLTGRNGGTYYPMCPRDTSLPAEESINCHCTTKDVVDQEILGMSLEDRVALREKYMNEVNAEYDAWEQKFNEEHGIEELRDDPSIAWDIYNSYYEACRNGEI